MSLKSIYRRVSISIHNDEDFQSLSRPEPNGQSLFMYLLTAKESLPIPGVIPAGKFAIAESLRWEKDMEGFMEAFDEALNKGMARVDWQARLIWLPKALYHNEPESPNVIVGWGKFWGLVPECHIKHQIYAQISDYCEMRDSQSDSDSQPWMSAFLEAFGEGYNNPFEEGYTPPFGEQERDQEREEEKEQDLKDLPENSDELSGEDSAEENEQEDDSEKPEVDKYPDATEEYVRLSHGFHTYQHKQYPTLLKEVDEKRVMQGADTLGKLERIDGYTYKEIHSVLHFIASDTEFWSTKVLSLARLRDKSNRNGEKKFVNAMAAMMSKNGQATQASRKQKRERFLSRED